MNNLPFVLKEFITSDEANNYVDYIEANKENFAVVPNGLRRVAMFGTGPTGSQDLYRDKDVLAADLINLKKKVEQAACTSFGERELYASLLWLSLHEPGATVRPHTDPGDGLATTRVYLGIIYLNDMKEDGHIHFPNLNFTYVPCKGDLVLFPTLDDDDTYLHEVKKISSNRYSILISLITDPELELTINGVQ
jgi:hypothetical protein